MTVRAILFDLDGTLVDSNDLHLAAWARAFAEAGVTVSDAAIRGQIGKGGDLLVPALAPYLDEAAQARLSDRCGAIFKAEHLDDVRPFPGAHALVAEVRRRGLKVVLASSASAEELDRYRDLLGIAELVDATTTIDDVATSKPAPDILATALAKLPGIAAAQALVIGDTPFDLEAAGKAGIPAIAVLSGGFDAGALREAGAAAIYDDVADVLRDIDAVLG